MSHSRKLVVPALLALGVFAMAPIATGLTGAIADGSKNLSFQVADIAPGGAGGTKNGGGTGATDKNGGGTGATDKNGGGTGGTDKNGGGTGGTDKNGGGNGGGGKGGGGNGNGGGGHGRGGNGGGNGYGGNGYGGGGNDGGMAYGGGSGGGDYQGQHIITCVINGQLIPVRSVRECRYGPGFVHNGNSYFGGGGFVEEPRYVQRRVIRRRIEANFGYVQQQRYVSHRGGYAGGFGGNVGGYASGENVYVGSNAAVMQAQRRARENGYGVDEGFGGSATYGNNGGYGAGYAYGEEQGYGMRRHHMRYAKQLRHHRQARGNMGGYRFGGDAGGCNCVDPGYVVHYGPTISKDGGY